jgi:hypothetical protein
MLGPVALTAAVLAAGGGDAGATSVADARRARASYPLTLLVQADAYADPTPAAPDDPPPEAGVRLRRVRAGEDLTVGDFRLRAVLEGRPRDAAGQYFTALEGGRFRNDRPMRLTDAFVSWVPSAAFNANLGAMRVPFSLSRQIDEAWLRLPERPAFVTATAPDFRVGAGIGGDLGALLYGAGVFAASRTLDSDLFARGAFAAARLVAEPIGPVGTMPWRRPASDPWSDWFRFAVGASMLYGTLLEARTLGAGVDVSAQWRRAVVTGEYLFQHVPAGDRQGAVIEPGLTVFTGRLDVAARVAWNRAASTNAWSAGLALTASTRVPALRVQAAIEQRTGGSYLAILRLTASID